MIIRLPCTRHSRDDELFVYVPYDELSREPPITLVSQQFRLYANVRLTQRGRDSVVVSTSAWYSGGPGSTPGQGRHVIFGVDTWL